MPVSLRPSATLPPGLDPSRIWGYRGVQVITEVENGGDFVAVGARYEYVFRCTGGLCRSELGLNKAAFAPAVPRYSRTDTSLAPGFRADSPCMPITATFTIVRQPDGSYRGTGSSVPRAVRASRGTQYCSWFSSSGTNVLTPILFPEPDPAAVAGPPALDPARITGYSGSRTLDGKTFPVTVTCDRGLCILPCPLAGCSSKVFFTAASPTASSGPIMLNPSCRNGTGAVSFARDGSGAYLVRARAAVQGAPAACTQDTSFRLRPVTG